MTRSSLIIGAALTALLFQCGKDASEPRRLRLATTTSTDASGLLPYLLPEFENMEGISVEVIAVGTGQALELGRRGDVDAVLVHARTLEDAFVAEGHGIDRRDIMWNDFVILGPSADPAGVRGLRDAAPALRKIADSGHPFVSRADGSGTHVREEALWARVGGVPQPSDTYLEAGQGMGKCLVIADQKQAYILADRGTYLAYRDKISLEVLVEGDIALHNPYGMILVNPERHPHVAIAEARKLLDYLTSPAGRSRISEFRVRGQILFHPTASE